MTLEEFEELKTKQGHVIELIGIPTRASGWCKMGLIRNNGVTFIEIKHDPDFFSGDDRLGFFEFMNISYTMLEPPIDHGIACDEIYEKVALIS